MSVSNFAEIRDDIATELTGALGAGWRVFPYPKQLQALEAGVGVVLIERTAISKGYTGMRSTTLKLHVVEPLTDLSQAEDSLEARIDQVLDALETTDYSGAFQSAEREVIAVGESSAHAYAITLEILTRN